MVDSILAQLKAAPRTRRQVAHRLARLGLADSAKELQRYRRAPWRGGAGRAARGPERLPRTLPNRKGSRIALWTEGQELELRRLFEELQDSDGGRCGAGGSGPRASGRPCLLLPLPLPEEGSSSPLCPPALFALLRSFAFRLFFLFLIT